MRHVIAAGVAGLISISTGQAEAPTVDRDFCVSVFEPLVGAGEAARAVFKEGTAAIIIETMAEAESAPETVRAIRASGDSVRRHAKEIVRNIDAVSDAMWRVCAGAVPTE